MKKRFVGGLLLVALFALIAMPIHAFIGSASGSKNSGRGGQKCAKISKSGRADTGAMTVGEVKVGGKVLKEGVDYKVRAGTNNSTRPTIDFTNPLAANVNVEVSLTTLHEGTFTVNVSLEC